MGSDLIKVSVSGIYSEDVSKTSADQAKARQLASLISGISQFMPQIPENFGEISPITLTPNITRHISRELNLIVWGVGGAPLILPNISTHKDQSLASDSIRLALETAHDSIVNRLLNKPLEISSVRDNPKISLGRIPWDSE